MVVLEAFLLVSVPVLLVPAAPVVEELPVKLKQ